MRAIWKASLQFIRQIWKDYMVIACLLVPILAGVVFHNIIPILEEKLCDYFAIESIFKPYYLLIDLFFLLLVFMMVSFAQVMVLLMELDDKTALYLCVTPLSKSGYLASRLLFINVAGILYAFILGIFFTLTQIPLLQLGILAVCSCFISLPITIMVVSIASNKVEGMALSKLSTFFILGVVVSYVVKVPFRYLASILPSFWFGEFARSERAIYLLPFTITTVGFLFLFYKKFSCKIA